MDHLELAFCMEKKSILEDLDPYQTGGEMIDFVSIEKSTYAPLPNKFEAGTPNIVGSYFSRLCYRFCTKIRNAKYSKVIVKI